MKKMLSFLCAMLILLSAVPAMADDVVNPMPAEMTALFDVPAWENYQVMTCYDGLHHYQAWIYCNATECALLAAAGILT